jgi:hypothetical protein
MAELAADTLLVLAALAAAAWVLLFDVLCIGSCTDTPRAGLWTWLALGCAGVGIVLLVRPDTRGLGRVLLAATVALAVAATLAA